jgi:ubiquinone/menaquinone biosynthesis C-methylase UbiE
MTRAQSRESSLGSAHTAFYDRFCEEYAQQWDSVETFDVQVAEFVSRLGTPGGVILDAGCGPGRDLLAFSDLGVRAIGVDRSTNMVRAVHDRGLSAVVGDLLDLGFADARFTGVWACASLVHFSTSEAGCALRELARVSTPGAVGRFTVKARTNGKERNGVEGTGNAERYFRYWDGEEFATAVGHSGWNVVSWNLTPDTSRTGLDWVEVTAIKPHHLGRQFTG